MTEKREVRAFAFDVRAEQNEQHGTYITGTPIVFDQATDMGWYQERIDHQALAGADLKDVRFLMATMRAGFRLPGAGTTTKTAPCR